MLICIGDLNSASCAASVAQAATPRSEVRLGRRFAVRGSLVPRPRPRKGKGSGDIRAFSWLC